MIILEKENTKPLNKFMLFRSKMNLEFQKTYPNLLSSIKISEMASKIWQRLNNDQKNIFKNVY